MEQDNELRSACFLALDALRAEFGEDVPYAGGLGRGFAFAGQRVPFFNPHQGIYRAGVQRGAAALSIMTSWRSPYDDEETTDGFLYAYRSGAVDHFDNRALRAAFETRVPIAYFVGVRAGWYSPLYPVFVEEDRLEERRVLVSPGVIDRHGPEPIAVAPEDALVRRYRTRETRVRLHQRRFRGLVLPAYRDQCAICRLKEVRLLDAAHIVRDAEPHGLAAVTNGLSFCSIHHRAFDQDLVGVAPDYRVHVSARLLEDDDGPMLELLKRFHGTSIVVPRSSTRRPDRERLGERFTAFTERS